MEERVMSLTMQQKRGLFWALGILIMATLTSVAWAQINTALTHCFSLFETRSVAGLPTGQGL